MCPVGGHGWLCVCRVPFLDAHQRGKRLGVSLLVDAAHRQSHHVGRSVLNPYLVHQAEDSSRSQRNVRHSCHPGGYECSILYGILSSTIYLRISPLTAAVVFCLWPHRSAHLGCLVRPLPVRVAGHHGRVQLHSGD